MANIIASTFFISFTFLSLLFPSKPHILGFTTNLIHRDSPDSPFYDPSLTRFDRLHNAVRRSHTRANHLRSASKKVYSISSKLIPYPAEYLMKISLGTPPVTMFAIIDTGSDVTWVQCTPCIKCFKQKGSLFDPMKSSTYKVYQYDSSKCQTLDLRYRSANDTCQYEVVYVDSSRTRGTFASETLTLVSKTSGRPISFPGFTFGCGFNNSGFDIHSGSGLIGLSNGPNSLISQIKPSINGKFSYCLTDSYAKNPLTSQINFGNNAEVSGTWVATTPIFPNEWGFMYLKLVALSVGKHKVKLFNSTRDSIINTGNIVIDSGTELMYLFRPIYVKFVDLVRKAMGSKTVHDQDFELCYKLSDKPLYPKIHAYFSSASIELKPVNMFVHTDKDKTCLAVMPVTDILDQTFGSTAQTNFLVGYDTIKGTVSFKATECGHSSH